MSSASSRILDVISDWSKHSRNISMKVACCVGVNISPSNILKEMLL